MRRASPFRRATVTLTHDRPPPPAAADPRLSMLLDSLIAVALAQNTPSPATILAIRYILAILATDAMGDACCFPRCACPIRDCSSQPSGRRPSR